VTTSREFAPWPELETARQNARILQGKYQDTAAALDRAHRALARIAERHENNGERCSYCWDNLGMDGDRRPWPCPDYLDATGQRHD
jgi:hypothetical protein